MRPRSAAYSSVMRITWMRAKSVPRTICTMLMSTWYDLIWYDIKPIKDQIISHLYWLLFLINLPMLSELPKSFSFCFSRWRFPLLNEDRRERISPNCLNEKRKESTSNWINWSFKMICYFNKIMLFHMKEWKISIFSRK